MNENVNNNVMYNTWTYKKTARVAQVDAQLLKRYKKATNWYKNYNYRGRL